MILNDNYFGTINNFYLWNKYYIMFNKIRFKKYNGVFMNEKRFTMSELKTLTYLRDKTDNNRKKYDFNKKVTLMKVTDAFIDYVTTINLTRSEYLLVQNVYDNVINKLNGNDEND